LTPEEEDELEEEAYEALNIEGSEDMFDEEEES
jgi:hypothetical protein